MKHVLPTKNLLSTPSRLAAKSIALLLLVLFVGVNGVRGQLLTEDFSYSTPGSIVTASSSSWTAHSGGTSSPPQYTNSGLTFTGHSGSGVGGAVTISTSGIADVNRTFTSQNSGTVYMSCLVNFSAATTTDYFLHFNSATFNARVLAIANSTNLRFGVDKAATPTAATTNFSFNTTYMLVVKYTFNSGGTTNDRVDLWVLSSFAATEAAAGTPLQSVTAGNDATALNAVGIRQGNPPTGTIDAIRVGTSWAQIAPASSTAPLAPTMGTITPGNQQLSVAFTAGSDGGSAITSYKYSTDGGATFLTRQTGTTASPIVITTLSSDGTTPLTNGASYNVQIRAVNAIGDGTATSSTSATPFTTPSAPTINSITAGNTQLSVAFTAGNDGGSTITNYQYSTDGGATFLTRQTGTTASPILITTLSSDGSTPLTNGVSYDVQIKAVNVAGAGAASSTSSGTPQAPVTPTITANGTLSSVNTTYGSASGNTSFTLSGATLTAGITVTPPVGFEVSTTSDFSINVGNNSNPLVVGSAPTVSITTIYVRLLATANVSGSPYSGNIVLSSSGASNVNVPTVTSSVSARELTISGLSASAKTYDGNTNVSIIGTPVFSGLQNGDLATVTGSPTFAFANANAGLTKSINQTGSYGEWILSR